MCLGEIVRLETVHDATATARVGDRTVQVSLLTLEQPVVAGDWVLVHSGFALHRLDAAEAAAGAELRAQTFPSPPIDRIPRPVPEEQS